MVKKMNDAPEGIKILAAAYFAGAFVLGLMGMLMFGFADSIMTTDPALLAASGLEQANTSTMVIIGVALVLFAILMYYLARDLLRSKNWAKIVVGIFSTLGIISVITNITKGLYFGSISGIILNGIIVWYLFFKDSTKKYFK